MFRRSIAGRQRHVARAAARAAWFNASVASAGMSPGEMSPLSAL